MEVTSRITPEERTSNTRMCETKWNPRGFDGLEVACWPLVPKFAGSDPTDRAKKSSARLPSEGK